MYAEQLRASTAQKVAALRSSYAAYMARSPLTPFDSLELLPTTLENGTKLLAWAWFMFAQCSVHSVAAHTDLSSSLYNMFIFSAGPEKVDRLFEIIGSDPEGNLPTRGCLRTTVSALVRRMRPVANINVLSETPLVLHNGANEYLPPATQQANLSFFLRTCQLLLECWGVDALDDAGAGGAIVRSLGRDSVAANMLKRFAISKGFGGESIKQISITVVVECFTSYGKTLEEQIALATQNLTLGLSQHFGPPQPGPRKLGTVGGAAVDGGEATEPLDATIGAAALAGKPSNHDLLDRQMCTDLAEIQASTASGTDLQHGLCRAMIRNGSEFTCKKTHSSFDKQSKQVREALVINAYCWLARRSPNIFNRASLADKIVPAYVPLIQSYLDSKK